MNSEVIVKKGNVELKVEDARYKAKRRLVTIVFSRTVVVSLLLLIQFGMLLVGALYLSEYLATIYWVMTVLGIVVVVHIVNKKGNPAFKLAWIIPVISLPIVGTTFYLFCEFQLTPKFLARRLQTLWLEIRPYMKQNNESVQDIRASKPANANLAHFLSDQVGYPLYQNTKITYFSLGEHKIKELLHQIEQANEYIFMEYFIIDKGVTWACILEALEKKVAQGVEVRLMYDGTCCFNKLPYSYPKYLRSKGINCKVFNPIKPVMSTDQNNRDHRKICVIDGKIGFTGGINIGDEYVNIKKIFGHWKDTAIMMEGDAVQSLTMMFLQLWNIDVRSKENYKKYLTPRTTKKEISLGYTLPYGDSPFDDENVGEQVYFHILNHAKKYVHIMTPYLIIDNEMLTNLKYTAKCGVEVIIIMPHIPDKKYAFVLAKTYYEELLSAGVQIYEYTPGFVHAKMFVSDDDSAVVGTINLDYRSLYLHFECGVFMYNNPTIRTIEADFQETLKKCQKVSLVDVKNRTFTEKVSGNLLRLIAPLM